MLKIKEEGLTIVEMMVVVGIVGIIFWGLLVVLSKTTNIWFFGIGQLDLQDQARETMYWIGNDFRNAKASSMGNLAQNSGFEEPLQRSLNPTGWEALVPDTVRVGVTSPYIKSGILGIKLMNGITYRSTSFNIQGNKNYILSTWVRNPGSFNLVRAVDNSDLIAPVSNSNVYWTHLTSVVNLAASQSVKLKLSMPSVGSWTACTDTGGWPGSHLDINSMAVYKDRLFVGDWESGRIYSYVETTGDFEVSVYTGINPHTPLMGVYDFQDGGGERLVVVNGMFDWGNPTSWSWWQLWYHTGNTVGVNWTAGWPTGAADYPTGSAPFTPIGVPSYYPRCIVTYYNKLYMGTNGRTNSLCFAQIREYDPNRTAGSRWVVIPWTNTENMVISLCVYNYGTGDKLYAGTAPGGGWNWHLPWGIGNVYVYNLATNSMDNGGLSVVTSAAGRPFTDLAVYKGKLYAAAGYLYVYDGSGPWTSVTTLGTVYSICVYNNRLYVGNLAGGIYESTDGVTWTAFTGIPANQSVMKMVVYNDTIYAGVSNSGWGAPKVYMWNNRVYFDDVSISPEEVVFDNSTVVGVNDTYTYYTCRGTSPTEYRRFKLYQLRYSPNTRELWREFSNDGGVTWNPDRATKAGVICKNVKSLRITNHNQETFEVELVLEKEVSAGKIREYRLKNTLTPQIS